MLRTCARNLQGFALRRNTLNVCAVNRGFCEKITKNENEPLENAAESTSTDNIKLSGFAKAFEKHSQPLQDEQQDDEKLPDLPFATLLRNSKLIELGDPHNKVVIGKIFHVVDDDLYIDFGWKFYCVCTRPQKNSAAYVRGARVKLRVKELELSTKFLGQTKDLTILEADCQIVGIMSSPAVPPRVKV